MRIIFMGSPDFALHALKGLCHSDMRPVAVFSQPPRPKGRGKKMQPTPVHQYAIDQNIPCHVPTELKSTETKSLIKSFNPDVIVVVAYGILLPQFILDIAPLGAVNLHASLLPKWRGAAPIERAVCVGDTLTGISFMKMVAALDAGPVLATQDCPITNAHTASTLTDELATIGQKFLPIWLQDLKHNHLTPVEQDPAFVTYAQKIQKNEGHIDWSQTAQDINLRVRAFGERPGTYFYHNDERYRLFDVAVSQNMSSVSHPPGTIINQQLHVACANNTVQLLGLQRSGRGRVSLQEFLNANPFKIGDILT